MPFAEALFLKGEVEVDLGRLKIVKRMKTVTIRDNYKEVSEVNEKNETKKIGTYVCQKATLNYCGRHWEAWFTKEVPLNKGPYFFDGLPGLIIYINDQKEWFTVGVRNTYKNSIESAELLGDENVSFIIFISLFF